MGLYGLDGSDYEIPPPDVGPIDIPSPPPLTFQAPPPSPIGLTYTDNLAAAIAAGIGSYAQTAAETGGKALMTGEELFASLLEKSSSGAGTMEDILARGDADFARLMQGDVGSGVLASGEEAAGGALFGPFAALLAGGLLPSSLGAADTVLDPGGTYGLGDFPMPELPAFELPPPPDFSLPPELTVFGDRPAPTRASEPPPLTWPDIAAPGITVPKPRPSDVGTIPAAQPGPVFVGSLPVPLEPMPLPKELPTARVGTPTPSRPAPVVLAPPILEPAPIPKASAPAPFLEPLPNPVIFPQPLPGVTTATSPLPFEVPLPQPGPQPKTQPSPTPILASPAPGSSGLPEPLTAIEPGSATLPLGQTSCPGSAQDTKRKQKYGCRQGYFRETAGGIQYTTWSTRKCPSSKIKSRSRQPGRPITS